MVSSETGGAAAEVFCFTHPEVAATFRCDSCERLICDDCVEEGHRLFFCPHCRERALPLTRRQLVTPRQRARARRLEKPVTRAQILGYAARGPGQVMLVTYTAVMALADLFGPTEGPVGLSGIVGLWIRALVWLEFGGLLFAIVDDTARGGDQMPDWPEIFELGSRLRELARLILVAALAGLPALLVMRGLGCSPAAWLEGGPGSGCWAALGVGLALGLPIGVLAFGAGGAYGSTWLVWRLDLHARALASPAGRDALGATLRVGLLLAASQAVALSLHRVPIAGSLVEHALTAYALFTGAHLVGLLFRRHAATLESIYAD